MGTLKQTIPSTMLTEGSRSERAHNVMLPVRFMGAPPVGAFGNPSESARRMMGDGARRKVESS